MAEHVFYAIGFGLFVLGTVVVTFDPNEWPGTS